jgi:hypothetical protein
VESRLVPSREEEPQPVVLANEGSGGPLLVRVKRPVQKPVRKPFPQSPHSGNVAKVHPNAAQGHPQCCSSNPNPVTCASPLSPCGPGMAHQSAWKSRPPGGAIAKADASEPKPSPTGGDSAARSPRTRAARSRTGSHGVGQAHPAKSEESGPRTAGSPASEAVEEPTLEAALGSVLAVRVQSGAVFQGELFALDGGVAVLRSLKTHSHARPSTHLVPLHHMTHVKVLAEAPKAFNPGEELPLPDAKEVLARERRTEGELRKELEAVGEGVSDRGQRAFDLLNKLLHECAWQGPSIVVMRAVVVDAPYVADSVRVVDASAPMVANLMETVRKQLARVK